MKKLVVILFLFQAFNLFGQTPEADYTLAIDFSVDDDNAPYPNYKAAYLINISNTILIFPVGRKTNYNTVTGEITYSNRPWMGQKENTRLFFIVLAPILTCIKGAICRKISCRGLRGKFVSH